MRLVAVTRVMNEDDIIEAMARHHAALVDHHVFLDNGSTDRTLDILQSLAAEGMPLILLRNTASVYADQQFNTTLYHWAVQNLAADWVLFLDADEFLDPRETPDIRAYLAGFVQEEIGISLELVDYEAPTPATADELNVARRLVRRRRHGSGWWKVFVNAPLDATHVAVASGNHHVILDGVQRGARQQTALRLAHFSNRSPYQFAAKVAAGRLKVLAAGQAETPATSSHYNGPFNQLRHNPLTWLHETLAHATRMQTDPILVEDPIRYLGQDLLYTEAVDYAARALAHTLGVAERMAAKFGALLDTFPDARARIDTELAGVETLAPGGPAAGYGAVVGGAWRHPADGGFTALMLAGWSAPEPWGMWGTGLHHQLRLYPAGSGIIECDVSAYIPPSRAPGGGGVRGRRTTRGMGIYARGKPGRAAAQAAGRAQHIGRVPAFLCGSARRRGGGQHRPASAGDGALQVEGQAGRPSFLKERSKEFFRARPRACRRALFSRRASGGGENRRRHG